MKKIFKILLTLMSTAIVSLNSLLVVSCGDGYHPIFTREDYVSMLNSYLMLPNSKYYPFVQEYENKIKNVASDISKKEFDNLYDDHSKTPIWNNYNTLEHDLTSTVLSPTVTINLDWTKMYHDVGLSNNLIATAQSKQLRFYNIISQLYDKNNILKLVQNITQATPDKRNTIAFTTYSMIRSQTMTYGPYFANLNMINHQYNIGFWTANDLIYVSTHEYGHAISNFLGEDATNRQNFNIIKVNNTINLKKSLTNKVNGKKVNNRADLLMNYLDDSANIGSDTTKRLLFPLIVVRSNYSRSAWIEGNYRLKDDFFAEAFAEWLDTPSNERNWNWELLNKFFVDYLPTFL